MKQITIKIISIETDKIIGYEIGSDNDNNNNKIGIYLNRDIYLGLLAEMKKANISVDYELKCLEGRIFTFIKKEWKRKPKDLDVMPIVFGVALRKDLEKIENERENERNKEVK